MLMCVSRRFMLLPVRRKNGTSAHRQLSRYSFSATNVSVVDADGTFGSLR